MLLDETQTAENEVVEAVQNISLDKMGADINRIWDLHMTGSARFDVENKYRVCCRKYYVTCNIFKNKKQ